MSCKVVCKSIYHTRIQNDSVFAVLEIATQKLFSQTQNVGMCVCIYIGNEVHKTMSEKSKQNEKELKKAWKKFIKRKAEKNAKRK